MENPTEEFDYGLHYRFFHDESPEHVALMEDQHRRELGPLLAHLPPNGRALDIGAGMGFALGALTTLGFRAEGVEADASQAATARRLGHRVHETRDLRAFLAQRPRTFDAVLMLDVLEHLPTQDSIPVLRLVAASLRPGGRLVLTVPNAISPLGSYWRYVDFTHTTSFTKESLRFLALSAGFTRIDVMNPSAVLRPSWRLWQRRSWHSWRRWFVKWLWVQIVMEELGPKQAAEALALGSNLLATADV